MSYARGQAWTTVGQGLQGIGRTLAERRERETERTEAERLANEAWERQQPFLEDQRLRGRIDATTALLPLGGGLGEPGLDVPDALYHGGFYTQSPDALAARAQETEATARAADLEDFRARTGITSGARVAELREASRLAQPSLPEPGMEFDPGAVAAEDPRRAPPEVLALLRQHITRLMDPALYSPEDLAARGGRAAIQRGQLAPFGLQSEEEVAEMLRTGMWPQRMWPELTGQTQQPPGQTWPMLEPGSRFDLDAPSLAPPPPTERAAPRPDTLQLGLPGMPEGPRTFRPMDLTDRDIETLRSGLARHRPEDAQRALSEVLQERYGMDAQEAEARARFIISGR